METRTGRFDCCVLPARQADHYIRGPYIRVVQKPSKLAFFEIKIMVKIGVIFMSFSNPTCHFRDIS